MISGRKGGVGTIQSSVTMALGEWVAGVRLDTLPRDVIRNAKRSIVDTFAAGLAGARTASADRFRDLAKLTYATGDCRLIAGSSLDAAGAAFANAASCHALDFDDTAYAASRTACSIHASVVVLPAVFAIADERDLPGDECLAAFIAGSEAAYFLCRLATPSFYRAGWFTTSVIGEIAAAAGCSRALGATPDVCGAAVGLAAARAGGTRICLGNDANLYATARAAEGGITAARLAASGARAAWDALEGVNGFLCTYNKSCRESKIIASLGSVFGFSDPGVWYKNYPICSAGQLVGELLEEFVRHEGIGPDEVRQVECVLPPLVCELLRYDIPNNPAEAQFSLKFIISHILTYGTLDPQALTISRLSDPRLQAVIRRVVVKLAISEHASAVDEGPARIKISLVGGRSIEIEGNHARGTPERPLSDEGLNRKFYACAAPAMSHDEDTQLLEKLWSLECVETVRSLAFA